VKNNQNKPRVIIDTNVLISGIVFGGKPRQILDLLSEQLIVVIVAEELFTELRRKISTKFPEFMDDLERVEKLLKRDAVIIKLGKMQITVCRVPDDNKFIESAVQGNCNYIISGDKDLLVLEHYYGIQIVKPAEFLSRFN
jgi:putative PIN family toxin of toxin-antitoxin system